MRYAPSALACATLVLSACTVGPDFVDPDVAVNPQWRAQSPDVRASESAADRAWWQALDSPTLDTLVDTAYRNNPNLQVAGVRILQAQAQLNIAIGAQFPQQQALTGSINYQYANPVCWTPERISSPNGLVLARPGRSISGVSTGAASRRTRPLCSAPSPPMTMP